MGQPAAKQGDQITAIDIHIIMIPNVNGAIPTPIPNPFNGILSSGLSTDVFIEGRPAATVNSIANNTPPHIPAGGPFQIPPTNQGQVFVGSMTVYINGQGAARNGDMATTCDDVNPSPHGTVVAVSTVFIGG